MQEINRNGVMIDVCPQCRGVWMDRGELEKLLSLVGERSRPEGGSERGVQRHHDRDYDRDDDYRRKKRKKRFELFDFFD